MHLPPDQGFMQDENVACRDLGTKYYSSTWSAVSERPNLNARLVSQMSQLERVTPFRVFSTTI